MRAIRRWLLVTTLAAAGVWIYAVAGSGATLLALFEGLDSSAALARVDVQRASAEPAANEPRARAAAPAASPPDTIVAETAGDLLPQQIATDELSAGDILRLLEDEVVSDTDPAAADELLRAFGESLETRD